MGRSNIVVVRSVEEVFDTYAMLAPRQNGCVECQNIAPSCPSTCPTGETCQFIVSLDCKTCASSQCAVTAQPTSTSNASSSSSPGGGVIAGGVIGGVAVIGIVTYLVWRFCIKTKRTPVSQQDVFEDTAEADERTEAEKEFAARRDQRSSTHTVHSIASTVLTRASNIIQIAYIPGVTNRATPTSPTLLVPPVPPIPMAVSNANSPTPYEEQHFFVPGDLRDSRYSGMSGFTERTSYARTSYAPRSSIASTIYGKNAVIVAPAQKGILTKPAVVSVKSSAPGSTASGASTPPMPNIDYEKFGRPKSRDSTFSIGSAFLSKASAATATQAKAQQIKVVRLGSTGSKRTIDLSDTEASSSSPPKLVRESATSNGTIIEESPPLDQGPFSDPPEQPSHRSTTSLSAVIEEATRRAAKADRKSKNLGSSERERSPFGDEHATNDD